MSLHNDIACNHLQFRVEQLEEELKNHYELLEWLVERVAGLESQGIRDRASVDPSPLSDVPTVPRQGTDVAALRAELNALRDRIREQEATRAEDGRLIDRLKGDLVDRATELELAREELVNVSLERDRERAQTNEWLAQLHDTKKELVRVTAILEAIRAVTEEMGFEMPEDLF